MAAGAVPGTVNASPPHPFFIPVRVYYEDTDAAGIVYYANYLRYLERARTDWLRSLGVEQQRLQAQTGLAFAVRAIAVEYLKPARLDDLLTVSCEVDSLRRAQIVFVQRIERNGELLLTASVRVACVDLARGRPAPLPEDFRKMLSS